MSDLAATHCNSGISSGNDCGVIIIILLLLFCCNGNGSGVFGGRDCNGSDNGCTLAIIIILLLFCCGNGNGFF